MNRGLTPAILFLLFIVGAWVLFQKDAHTATYHHTVAPLIQKNCLPCHAADGPAQMPLTNYSEVTSRASAIKEVLANGYMPPFKTDPDYRHFKGEKKMPANEIAALTGWIENGMPQGYPFFAPKYSRAKIDTQSSSADYTLTLPNPLCFSGKMKDVYVYYPFYLHNTEELDVRLFELTIDNRKIVHHAWLFVSTKTEIEKVSPLWKGDVQPVIKDALWDTMDNLGMMNYLLYTPGTYRRTYVKGACKKLPQDAAVVLQVHYFIKNNDNICDQSSLRVIVEKEGANRTIFNMLLDETFITNPPFVMQPEKVHTFQMASKPMPDSTTLLKISPHMHYRGKKFKVYAVTPTNDTIKLLKIDNWDFNWQGAYSFDPLVVLPKGTVICAEAVLDNTSGNIANPVIPPVVVKQGMHSTDEMFQMVIECMPYVKGDEWLRPE